MKSRTKKIRKLFKPPLVNVARSMGKWKPNDDYLLIQSVLHLSNMNDVYNLTKFANKFSINELEERWYAILYDGPISSMIYKNIQKLHPDDMIRLNKLVPFNQNEDFLLLNLESNIDEKNEEFFENFLLQNRVYFHKSRTSKCLIKQFKRFKKLNLLKDQATVEKRKEEMEKNEKMLFKNSSHVKFSQLEQSLNDEKIFKEIQVSEKLEKEIKSSYDCLLKQIKRSEADLFLWQSLVDKVTGNSNPFVDPDTLAVLFNENLNYTMKSNEIFLGRNSSTNQVIDIDLTKLKTKQNDNDDKNNKISRKQCSIRFIESDVFYLYNHGRMPVFVDGKCVCNLFKTQLYDKSIIQIDDINFLFLINYNNVQQKNSSSHLFSSIA